MIRVQARIEGVEKTSDEFKEARKDIYRRTKRGLKEAGERTILPIARRSTERETPRDGGDVVVKTTASYAYLTCRTKKAGRIVGLLNFGGTLRDPIQPRVRAGVPRRARGDKRRPGAVKFGNVIVARVERPRRYTGAHFLERARDQGMDEYGRVLLVDLMHAFDGLEHTP